MKLSGKNHEGFKINPEVLKGIINVEKYFVSGLDNLVFRKEHDLSETE
jgi:hypothetical protein